MFANDVSAHHFSSIQSEILTSAILTPFGFLLHGQRMGEDYRYWNIVIFSSRFEDGCSSMPAVIKLEVVSANRVHFLEEAVDSSGFEYFLNSGANVHK